MSNQNSAELTTAALAEDNRRLLLAQVISRVGSWYVNTTDGLVKLSEVVHDLHGMRRDSNPRSLLALSDGVAAENRHAIKAAVSNLREHGTPMAVRYSAVRFDDGRQRWFDARGTAERDADGTVVGLIGTVADVTELVEAEIEAQAAHDELSQAHAFQQAVIAATPDAIHIYDVATGRLSRANRSGIPLVGFTPEMVRVLAGESVAELIPAEDVDELQLAFTQARAAGADAIRIRHRVRDSSGAMRWLSRRLAHFQRDEHGVVTHLLVVSRDVTDVVEMEQQLEHAALHDELTGLPNRRLIHDRLEQSLHRASRGGHTVVLVCDLDGFKQINDTRGHPTGDRVLQETAARLMRAIRVGDTAGRLGGDEFVVILEIPQHQNPQSLAEEVAQRLTTLIAQPIDVDGSECAVTASVGIRIGDSEATAESLLSDADAAMYYIKTHGADGHVFFESSQRPDTASRDYIHEMTRRALQHDLVQVHYQPIVDPYTESLHAVEALVRVPDADGKFLNTADVIAIAEQTGLITSLDERVLQLACNQAAAWRREPALAHLSLELNRSVTDITRPGFHQRISAALTSSGLDASALTLEITETVLLDATQENLADLRQLHAQGVGLAIDDFGTGYASLRYLAELPITCIKIDQSFTAGLPHNATAMTLVRATIGLAQQLEINCIVEGVETVEQLRSLPSYDRLFVQGYLYARPQPATKPLRTSMKLDRGPAKAASATQLNVA